METRANYFIIGLFTVAVVFGVFGFIYWFQNGIAGERAYFRVVFDNSVSGLRTGSAVMFNGIRVGEVTELRLNSENPEQVVALISIEKKVPVHTDTRAGIEFQGLTGIAAVGLGGGSTKEAILNGSRENPPEISASRGSTQDVTQGARDVLRRIDDFIASNQQTLHNTMTNLETLSQALARNSARLDHIMENIDTLTGGADGKSGEVMEMVRSIHALSDNLDKRAAEISDGVNKLTSTTTKTVEQIGRDARGVLGTVDRTFKDLDQNPSRLLFGGSKK